MVRPIDMNIGVCFRVFVFAQTFWKVYFSQNIAKVMSNRISKEGQNPTALQIRGKSNGPYKLGELLWSLSFRYNL